MNIKPSKLTVVDNRGAIEAKMAVESLLLIAAALRNDAFPEI